MTEAEDEENARKNAIISVCDHDIRKLGGSWKCTKCDVTVMLAHLPRKARPAPYGDDSLSMYAEQALRRDREDMLLRRWAEMQPYLAQNTPR